MFIAGMLAERVIVAHGRLYIHGGGLRSTAVAGNPATLPSLGVAVTIEGAANEFTKERTFSVRVVDETGEPIRFGHDGTQRAVFPISVDGNAISHDGEADSSPSATLALGVNIELLAVTRDSSYHVHVLLDDEVRVDLPLSVTGYPEANEQA